MLKVFKVVVIVVGLVVTTLLVDDYFSSKIEKKQNTLLSEFTSYLNKVDNIYTVLDKEYIDSLVESNFVEYYNIEEKANKMYMNTEGLDFEEYLYDSVDSAPDVDTAYMFDFIEDEWVVKEEYRHLFENNETTVDTYGQDIELHTIDGRENIKVDDIVFNEGVAYINYKVVTLDIDKSEIPLQRKAYKEAQELKFVLDTYNVVETGDTKELNARYTSLNGVIVNLTISYKENIIGGMTLIEQGVYITNEN